MQAAFPGRAPQQQQDLAGWLAAACGLPSSSSTTTAGDHSSSSASPLVTAAQLAAAAGAVQQELRRRFGAGVAAAAAAAEACCAAEAPQNGSVNAAAQPVADGLIGAVGRLAEGVLRQHQQQLLVQHNSKGQDVI